MSLSLQKAQISRDFS